jgi:aldose 1-epimerase
MKNLYGTTPDGQKVLAYTLANRNGVEARIITYGGILISLRVPDRTGTLADVVLGYDTLEGYLADKTYQGAVIGRCAGRLSGAAFTLNGKRYPLAANNGTAHIHGGLRGFDKVIWVVDERESDPGRSLTLRHRSPDGDEGYPGTLDVRVAYSLSEENDLFIEYAASTNKPTIVNLTQHAYFNLAGPAGGSILDHELFVDADRFLPIDQNLIPTGKTRPVKGTPMDFTSPAPIGARINADDEQIRRARGYDQNWVLNPSKKELRIAAVLHHRASGRFMGVFTTEPGLQVYSGNFLDGSAVGKGGTPLTYRKGLCLETQHFPDAPNRPEFPSIVLEPGSILQSTTVYRFTTR